MDKARNARRPWRSWTAIALVLTALALAQACGQSGSRTGPTTNAAIQLKLRRAGLAQIPPTCSGVYSVTGPGVNIQNQPLPAGGGIAFQGVVGQTYNISVSLDCGPQGLFDGSATVVVTPEGSVVEIVLNASEVLGLSCSPSTVGPNEPSTCRCNVRSAVNPTITWTGPVTPKSGPVVTFRERNPGTYTVTCTVNGVDTAPTAVTVEEPAPAPPPPPPPSGTIEIFNSVEGFLGLRRRDLSQHLGCCPIWARVLGIAGTSRQIDAGHSAKVSAPPGSRRVQGACDSGFSSIQDEQQVNVVADQEIDVFFFFSCD